MHAPRNCNGLAGLALCEGRSGAIPERVQRLVATLLVHRVVLRRATPDPDSVRAAIKRAVDEVPMPLQAAPIGAPAADL